MDKMKFKVFESSEGNVWKYVFTSDEIVTETVLYKYNSFEERTVICCSVQSGCRVGCSFCGTGRHFIRSLTPDEIMYQVETTFKDKNIETDKVKKLQIMFMSMGEPMDNIDNVIKTIRRLNKKYPNAQLLLSTVGLKNDEAFNKIIKISKEIDKVGLQFSIHEPTDERRNKLIPFKNKYTLRELRNKGIEWWNATGRNVYLNYVVTNKNNSIEDANKLMDLFSPVVFKFTFSVLSEPNKDKIEESIKQRDEELSRILKFQELFLKNGYNTRVFNPAGQDDIGGGCGQLHYVQDYFKQKKHVFLMKY